MGSLFPKGPQTFIVCLPKMVCSLLIKYPMVSKMLLISPSELIEDPMAEERARRERERGMWNAEEEKKLCAA